MAYFGRPPVRLGRIFSGLISSTVLYALSATAISSEDYQLTVLIWVKVLANALRVWPTVL